MGGWINELMEGMCGKNGCRELMIVYAWFEGEMRKRVIEGGKEEVEGVDSGRMFELKQMSAMGA